MSTVARIGLLMPSLGASQLSFHVLEQADAVLSRGVDVDLVVFYQNAVRPWKVPTFATLNISECYEYDGVAVATDLVTAEQMMKCPGPSARYFYIWDLDWVRGRGYSYDRMAAVYCNPMVRLLTRCEGHSRLVADAWNRDVRAVVGNFDLDRVVRVVREDGAL